MIPRIPDDIATYASLRSFLVQRTDRSLDQDERAFDQPESDLEGGPRRWMRHIEPRFSVRLARPSLVGPVRTLRTCAWAGFQLTRWIG